MAARQLKPQSKSPPQSGERTNFFHRRRSSQDNLTLRQSNESVKKIMESDSDLRTISTVKLLLK